MNVNIRRMHKVRNEEEFRARVDGAVEFAKVHLDGWRAEFAARPQPLDPALFGLAINIRDGRRDRDNVIALDANGFDFWREFLCAIAARSDLDGPNVFEDALKPTAREPRLIERIPYMAVRFETAATLSHALLGAISRWQAATPEERGRMQ